MNLLKNYCDIGNALVELFQPLVEIVIHDIKTQKIIFIQGDLSKRKVNDPSLMDDPLKDIDPKPYFKINFDGRLIKSVSIPIKKNDKIIAIMCINYDISLFQDFNSFINVLIDKKEAKKPESLFSNDWQNKINEFVASEIKSRNIQLAKLNNKDKKKIIHRLFESGAFAEKNSADYIAKIMDMGRATVFNYLRNFKKDNHEI